MSKNKRLLFVGGFSVGKDGTSGGTAVACMQLLRTPFSNVYDITKIDVAKDNRISSGLAARFALGLRRVGRLAFLLLGRRIDVALIFATLGPSWWERGLMVMLCRIGGVPAFISPRHEGVITGISGSRVARTFTASIVRCCAGLIFQSESICRRFCALVDVPDDKVHVLPNWIDTAWTKDVGPPEPSPPVNVICVALYERYKGLDVLLEAIRRRASQLSHCQFLLRGTGPERPLLLKAIAPDMPVALGGWLSESEKPAFFSKAHILVLPSRSEGLPNVILEAMAAGRPVVATRVGSIPDIVDDGVEGFLVPPENPDALADALMKLAADRGLRDRMGEAGKGRIGLNHDLQRAWRRLVEVLDGPFSGGLPLRGHEREAARGEVVN